MKDFTNAYARIIKQEKQEDGTLLVYGKATDDSLDVDQQICDATWLDRAMPDWFKSGGNIREQHSNIAAGVAKEYEPKGDGHYITALVVDPVSVKKVETGVLKGFSIGIKMPRVVRDEKAVNGRIIDGQIVEVSLVDRPANPNAKLMLAKCDSNQDLVKVEEMITPEENKEADSGQMPMSGESKNIPSRDEMMNRYTDAKKAYDEICMMCKEYGYELPAEEKQYGESAEEESAEGPAGSGAEHELEETKSADTGKCLECGCNAVGSDHGLTQITVADGTAGAETSNVSTAEIVSPEETPKSAEKDSTVESEEKNLLSDPQVAEILEKAVKSASDSVKSEIDSFKAAKEVAEKRISQLESELAVAITKAVGGGPKRSVIKAGINETKNEMLTKASYYSRKASTTTDPDLVEGYKKLAKEFQAKAISSIESE
jgi:hypothetical protein